MSAGGGYSYNFSGKRGAIAVLKDGGVQETINRSTAFQEYIYKHHMSWHTLARGRGISVRVEDIVLVSGCTKTAGWAIAAYDNRESSHEGSVSINGGAIFSGNSTFSLEEKNETGIRHREGPELPKSPPGSPVSPDTPKGERIFERPANQCLAIFTAQTRIR